MSPRWSGDGRQDRSGGRDESAGVAGVGSGHLLYGASQLARSCVEQPIVKVGSGPQLIFDPPQHRHRTFVAQIRGQALICVDLLQHTFQAPILVHSQSPRASELIAAGV